MNLEDVSRYIQQPSSLTLADAASLKSMSEKHPYAAIFSLLYLTALANGKSIDLEHALQEHAYRLSDRTKLYYLVHQEGLVAENTLEVTPELSITEPEIIAETTDRTIETEVPLTLPVSEEADESVNPKEEIAREDFFVAETIAFTLEQEYIPETSSKAAESDSVSKVVPQEDISTVENLSEVETPKIPEPQKQPDTHERRSFTSWLKSNHSEASPESDENTAAQSKMAASDIIDRFIAEEPTISRPKSEFFSPPKKAKESLDENAIPVSETLAKIYAAQGNYPKAIHVYHQLMLAFPEKKLFFAVRIDELKKKITT